MSEILTASSENQEFFFKVIKKIPADRTTNAPEEVHIEMYKTPYVFIKTEGKWRNKSDNKLEMGSRLIDAVIHAIEL